MAMTAEEQEKLQAAMKEAMAKTREQNLQYIKDHNLGGMIAAREGLDKLKEKAGGIASEIKANFKADEGAEGAQKAKSMFANLWKSGITGKIAIVVAAFVLYKVIRCVARESKRTIAKVSAPVPLVMGQVLRFYVVALRC